MGVDVAQAPTTQDRGTQLRGEAAGTASAGESLAGRLQFIDLDEAWTMSVPVEGGEPIVVNVKSFLDSGAATTAVVVSGSHLVLRRQAEGPEGPRVLVEVFEPGSIDETKLPVGDPSAVGFSAGLAARAVAYWKSATSKHRYLATFGLDGRVQGLTPMLGRVGTGAGKVDAAASTFYVLRLDDGDEIRLDLAGFEDQRVQRLTFRHARMLIEVSRTRAEGETFTLRSYRFNTPKAAPPAAAQTTATAAVVEGEQAVVEGEQAVVEGEQAVVEGEQAVVEGEQAVVEGEQAVVEGEQAVVEGKQELVEPVAEGAADVVEKTLVTEMTLRRDQDGRLRLVELGYNVAGAKVGGTRALDGKSGLKYLELPLGKATLRLELGLLDGRTEHRLAFAGASHTIVLRRHNEKAEAAADAEDSGLDEDGELDEESAVVEVAAAGATSVRRDGWSIEIYEGGADRWAKVGFAGSEADADASEEETEADVDEEVVRPLNVSEVLTAIQGAKAVPRAWCFLRRDKAGVLRMGDWRVARGRVLAGGKRGEEGTSALTYLELPFSDAKLRLELGKLEARRELRLAFAAATHTIMLTRRASGAGADVGDTATVRRDDWSIEIYEGGADRWAKSGLQGDAAEASDDEVAAEVDASVVLAALRPKEDPLAWCYLSRDEAGTLRVVDWHLAAGRVMVGGAQALDGTRALTYLELPLGKGAKLRLERGRIEGRREHRLAFAAGTHTIVISRRAADGADAEAPLASWSLEVYPLGIDAWRSPGLRGTEKGADAATSGAAGDAASGSDGLTEVSAQTVLAALQPDAAPVVRCLLMPDAAGALRVAKLSVTHRGMTAGKETSGDTRRYFVRLPLGAYGVVRIDQARLMDAKQTRLAVATARHVVVLTRTAASSDDGHAPADWTAKVYLNAVTKKPKPKKGKHPVDEAQALADAEARWLAGKAAEKPNQPSEAGDTPGADAASGGHAVDQEHLEGKTPDFTFALTPSPEGALQVSEISAQRDGVSVAVAREPGARARGNVTLALPAGGSVAFEAAALDDATAHELRFESARYRVVLRRQRESATLASSWQVEVFAAASRFAPADALQVQSLPPTPEATETPSGATPSNPDQLNVEMLALAVKLDAAHAEHEAAQRAATRHIDGDQAEFDAIVQSELASARDAEARLAAFDPAAWQRPGAAAGETTWTSVLACGLARNPQGAWAIVENSLVLHLGGRGNGAGLQLNLSPNRYQSLTRSDVGAIALFHAPGEFGVSASLRVGAMGLAGEATLAGAEARMTLAQTLRLPTLHQHLKFELSPEAQKADFALAWQPKKFPTLALEGQAQRDGEGKLSTWKLGAKASHDIARDLGLAAEAGVTYDSDGLRRFIEAELSVRLNAFAALSLGAGATEDKANVTLTVSLLNPLVMGTGNGGPTMQNHLDNSLLQVFMTVERAAEQPWTMRVGVVKPISE